MIVSIPRSETLFSFIRVTNVVGHKRACAFDRVMATLKLEDASAYHSSNDKTINIEFDPDAQAKVLLKAIALSWPKGDTVAPEAIDEVSHRDLCVIEVKSYLRSLQVVAR